MLVAVTDKAGFPVRHCLPYRTEEPPGDLADVTSCKQTHTINGRVNEYDDQNRLKHFEYVGKMREAITYQIPEWKLHHPASRQCFQSSRYSSSLKRRGITSKISQFRFQCRPETHSCTLIIYDRTLTICMTEPLILQLQVTFYMF